MKRSEINNIISNAIDFFKTMNYYLPPFAYWSQKDWQANKVNITEIIQSGMGWDITSFGHPNFLEQGLVLFTVRNGMKNQDGSLSKTYCEKIMIVQEKQVTPMHFHWQKTEDIINRGGGNLILKLYNATEDEKLADTPVTFQKDGVTDTIEAGGFVTLITGESITLTPYMYHTFYGEEGKGPVLIGEVSTVNDDENDNCFYQPQTRFPDVEEDEPPKFLLTSDYE